MRLKYELSYTNRSFKNCREPAAEDTPVIFFFVFSFLIFLFYFEVRTYLCVHVSYPMCSVKPCDVLAVLKHTHFSFKYSDMIRPTAIPQYIATRFSLYASLDNIFLFFSAWLVVQTTF